MHHYIMPMVRPIILSSKHMMEDVQGSVVQYTWRPFSQTANVTLAHLYKTCYQRHLQAKFFTSYGLPGFLIIE